MKIFKGTIITCDEQDNVFKYLVEENGSILFTGDTLPDKYKENTIIDLGEKALIPSFTDSHLHFTSYALIASTLDVRDVFNFQDLAEMIKDYIQTAKPKVILGFGVSAHSVEEQRMITRTELDQIEKTIPMMLVKYDGHASVVNSAMLKLLPKKLSNLCFPDVRYQPDSFPQKSISELFNSEQKAIKEGRIDYIKTKLTIYPLPFINDCNETNNCELLLIKNLLNIPYYKN